VGIRTVDRGQRAVTVERTIPAPAHRLFDLVADPAMHPLIDGSGTVKAVADGAPHRLAPGVRFGMAMRIGTHYRITNTVVEFEEGRLLAWDHMGRARWRYRFEPLDGGRSTRVVETWDYSTAPRWLGLALGVLGFRRRNRRGMERTLERLEAQVTARPEARRTETGA
jgi:uncharacterized protein YndB with AHSA1/START domain